MTYTTWQKIKTVTTKGDKPFVVMPLEHYESLLATLEEMSDPGAFEAIRESREDVRCGRLTSHAQVFADFDEKTPLHPKGRKGSKKD